MRGGGVAFLAVTLLAGVAGCARSAHDVAVWVYGAHRWATELERELSRLPGGTRRLYLSVEEGTRLLVDDPRDAGRLAETLDVAHGRFDLVVEAMLLQDPSWAFNPEGAAGRAGRRPGSGSIEPLPPARILLTSPPLRLKFLDS